MGKGSSIPMRVRAAQILAGTPSVANDETDIVVKLSSDGNHHVCELGMAQLGAKTSSDAFVRRKKSINHRRW
jgi:hypothetical protein